MEVNDIAIDINTVAFRVATDDDVPTLRRLVNAAYRELAEMGLNFTGTYQDEAITRERMQGNEVYLAFAGDKLVGTICLEVEERPGEPKVMYLTQFAVEPSCKRQGIGKRLLKLAEQRAREKGIDRMQLDTAKPAAHLVALYEGQGFTVIDEIQWEGKTYSSYIMEKIIE